MKKLGAYRTIKVIKYLDSKYLRSTGINAYRNVIQKSKCKFSRLYYKLKSSDFPQGISIQTHSYCDARCIMCPYGKVKTKHGKMDESLFKKIVDECSEYNVRNIHPGFLNEPLLDNRIFNFIEYAKKKIPSTHIHIFSNGASMTKEKAEKLVKSGLDEIIFSFHGITKKTYEKNMKGLNFEKTLNNINYLLSLENTPIVRIAAIKELMSEDEFRDWEYYWKTQKNVDIDVETLHTRAETIVDEQLVNKAVKQGSFNGNLRGCSWNYPLTHFCIHWDGDVVLCCMDWQRELVIGNVKAHSIKEIWHSPKYRQIREKIYIKNDNPNFICERCKMAIRDKKK